MKERPILFSGSMVRALLDGRKTQTRRIVKLEPFHMAAASVVPAPGADAGVFDGLNADGSICFHSLLCPYGKPGDRLWVRESIRLKRTGYAPPMGEWAESEFIADGALTKADAWPWKNKALPAIHCPRGLSRITLEVTGVRVERLTDISDIDAQAEGIKQLSSGFYGLGGEWFSPFKTARDAFRALWKSINGEESWDANPWVWAITFRRVES